MFFHFRSRGLRWDLGVKCCFCVFILVWGAKMIPFAKLFSIYIGMENSEDKTGNKTALRVRTLGRKF